MNKLVKQKLFVGIVVMLAIGLILAGCATKAPAPSSAPAKSSAPAPASVPAKPSAPAPAPAKAIQLRFASGLLLTHPTEAIAQWFCDEIGKRSGGRVAITTYHGGQLFGHTAMMNAVQTKSVEMAIASTGSFFTLSPAYAYPNYFFLCDNADTWKGSMKAVGEVMDDVDAKFGFKFLYAASYDEVGLVSKNPVQKIEDMKGLRVAAKYQGGFDSVEALGAVPYDIPTEEVYDALGKGTVNAYATGLGTLWTRKHYEVAKYFLTTFNISSWQVIMNMDAWKGLPKDIQDIIMKAAGEAEQRNFEAMVTSDADFQKRLGEKLVTKVLTPEERKAWAAKVQPAIDKWLKDCASKGYGSQGQKMYDAFIKAR